MGWYTYDDTWHPHPMCLFIPKVKHEEIKHATKWVGRTMRQIQSPFLMATQNLRMATNKETWYTDTNVNMQTIILGTLNKRAVLNAETEKAIRLRCTWGRLGWNSNLSPGLDTDEPKIYIFHNKVSLSEEHQTHTQTDCNDIWPQTAQFYNESITTNTSLVTWKSTVHEPPWRWS